MIRGKLGYVGAWVFTQVARLVVWVAVNGDPFGGKSIVDDFDGCPNCQFLSVSRSEHDTCPHCGWGPDTEPEKTPQEARKDFLAGVEQIVKERSRL